MSSNCGDGRSACGSACGSGRSACSLDGGVRGAQPPSMGEFEGAKPPSIDQDALGCILDMLPWIDFVCALRTCKFWLHVARTTCPARNEDYVAQSESDVYDLSTGTTLARHVKTVRFRFKSNMPTTPFLLQFTRSLPALRALECTLSRTHSSVYPFPSRLVSLEIKVRDWWVSGGENDLFAHLIDTLADSVPNLHTLVVYDVFDKFVLTRLKELKLLQTLSFADAHILTDQQIIDIADCRSLLHFHSSIGMTESQLQHFVDQAAAAAALSPSIGAAAAAAGEFEVAQPPSIIQTLPCIRRSLMDLQESVFLEESTWHNLARLPSLTTLHIVSTGQEIVHYLHLLPNVKRVYSKVPRRPWGIRHYPENGWKIQWPAGLQIPSNPGWYYVHENGRTVDGFSEC